MSRLRLGISVSGSSRKLSMSCLTLLFVLLLLSIWLNVSLKQKHGQFSRSFSSLPSFIQSSERLPWKNFSSAIETRDHTAILGHVASLIDWLTPYVVKEPLNPINISCIPPPLRSKDKLNCTLGLSSHQKKIGLLIQFGFEVDTLEIHLNELADTVDKIFIIESTRTHGGMFRKPLIWEEIKGHGRFTRFLPKIVHFIVDDADLANITNLSVPNNGSFNWNSEQLQEKLRWTKFIEWNIATGFFNETDLLGFGDVDEVPGRETVNYLKHCNLPSDPIDVGIWFPFGAIDQIFRPDFPVKGHPFSLGDPTFWTLKSALHFSTLDPSKYPSRNRGSSAGHVLGGMHMTHYGYLPSLLIKRVTPSESSYDSFKKIAKFHLLAKNNSLHLLQKYYWELPIQLVKSRIFPLELAPMSETEKKRLVVVPWFYSCNRGRYPAWERKDDSRLY